MAKKKNEWILPVGIIAVLAGVWYFTRDTTGAAALPGTTAPAGSLPGTVSTNGASTLAQQSAPVQTGTPSVIPNNSVDLVLTNWFDELDTANKNQAYAQLPNMSADEKNNLANIIVNVWMKGVAPTPDETTFWNTWRVKYHIEDGTFA